MCIANCDSQSNILETFVEYKMTCAVDIQNYGSPSNTDCNNEKPTFYCYLRAFLLLCGAILALVLLHGPYTESLYGGPVQKIEEIIQNCSTNCSKTYTKATKHIFEEFLKEFYEDENLTEEMKKGESRFLTFF